MKILIASDTYYPHVNGCSYFTQRIAQSLAGAGHQVAVIAPSLTTGNDTIMRGGVPMYGLRSFPVFVVPKFRFVIPYTINARIRRIFDEFKPDVVHIQMHFPVSRAVLKEARTRGIPVVATNHFMPDNITHYFHLPQKLTEDVNALMWRDAARTLKKTRNITVPTHTAAAMLEPWVEKPPVVISNGIDRARFKPENDAAPARLNYRLPQKPTLLFVGRLDKEKRIDIVLRALPAALAKTDFQFVIAGHGAEERVLKSLAHSLGIAQNVIFTGFVPDELLPSLYASADCFVTAGIAELQCIVAMEAMATGLPVLAARAVALPELVHDGENGYLFEPGNSDQLSGQLIKVFSDESLRKQMGRKSLEIISHHDIKETLSQFENFYREAMVK